MIDKKEIEAWLDKELSGTDMFPVSVEVTASGEIRIEVDSEGSVDIDRCVELSRDFEEAFPRDDEDYELEIGSAGITSPLRVRRQYDKNAGHEVEVLTRDGRKLAGTLLAPDDKGFTLRRMVKVRPEGAKRPMEQPEDERFAYADCKSVVPVLKF